MTAASMTTTQLKRELAIRHRRLQNLIEKRNQINFEIKSLGGDARLQGSRAKNETPLVPALKALLKGREMTVTKTAEAVQKAGYTTTSPNFRTIVNQALINTKNFRRCRRGVYTAR